MNAPRFVLRRLSQTDLATFGHLEDDEGRVICVTLEEPYVDKNHDGLTDQNVSCVPAGSFEAYRRLNKDTRHDYDVFELLNVPGRKNVQIHIGNTTAHTEGCILLGTKFDVVNGQNGITGSRPAFEKFMKRLTGVDRITLTVINPEPADGA